MPESAVRAVALSATTVSTMPSWSPPIAATSLTLVRTAAIPAPHGSARTNGGHSASPQAITVRPSASTAAPSSPGPSTHPTSPSTSDTNAIERFAAIEELLATVAATSSSWSAADLGWLVMAARLSNRPYLPIPAAGGSGRSDCRKVNDRHSIDNVRPSFLSLPPRPDKPRTAGLTHVLDKGLTPGATSALLDIVGEQVDVWKFGWGVAYVDPGLPRKIAYLREHEVASCLGGTLLEIAWSQGKE